MNLYSLPNSVREQIKSAQGSDSEPYAIARSNACMDGTSGEAYLVSLKDKLFIFSRRMGQSDYEKLELSYADDIAGMSVRKEPYDVFLDITAHGKNRSVKFANYLADSLKPIIEQWQSIVSPASVDNTPIPPPLPPSDQPTRHRKAVSNRSASAPPPIPISRNSITPFEAMLAAMMYAATVDNEVHPTELRLITNISSAVTSSFDRAQQYYENNSVGELFSIIADYDYQQKICILSNIMELCMADGFLRSKEQDFIKNYCEFTGTPTDDTRRIYDVLLIKNQTSVLQGKK